MKKLCPMAIARITLRMDQADLAVKIGRSPTVISNFELGRTRVSARDRKKIAKALKTTEEALFG